MIKIGHGFDIHAFGSVKPLIIGGVLIPYKTGLFAYSNGDVLVHSVIDALLGAVSKGDIGSFFPSNDPKYKNIDSRILLKKIWKTVQLLKYEICNLDVTLIAECPIMSPYIFSMKSNLSIDLKTCIENISIKATSSKKIGCIGRKEGISCHSVVLLMKKSNMFYKKSCE